MPGDFTIPWNHHQDVRRTGCAPTNQPPFHARPAGTDGPWANRSSTALPRASCRDSSAVFGIDPVERSVVACRAPGSAWLKRGPRFIRRNARVDRRLPSRHTTPNRLPTSCTERSTAPFVKSRRSNESRPTRKRTRWFGRTGADFAPATLHDWPPDSRAGSSLDRRDDTQRQRSSRDVPPAVRSSASMAPRRVGAGRRRQTAISGLASRSSAATDPALSAARIVTECLKDSKGATLLAIDAPVGWPNCCHTGWRPTPPPPE